MEPLTTGLLIALMVASCYFLIIRPNKKRQADAARLAETMTPGTRVMLNSGIYGTVREVGERQVRIEIGPGQQVLVLKQAVLQVITPESQFAEDAVFGGTVAPGDDDHDGLLERGLQDPPADDVDPRDVDNRKG